MILEDKIMKYVVFKKRTEYEVKNKLKNLSYEADKIDEIIEYLKETDFINDKSYVDKYLKDIKNLKKCSVLEIKYDLLKRGISEDIIDSIIDDDLYDFELLSAIDLAKKKYKSCDKDKIKRYLAGKGYIKSNILKAIDNLDKVVDNY
jgi:regulatory protein